MATHRPLEFVRPIISALWTLCRSGIKSQLWVSETCEPSSPSRSWGPSRKRRPVCDPARTVSPDHGPRGRAWRQILDRIRRRLVLTGEGEQLLGGCRGILTDIASLKDRAQLLRRPDAGTLKVAATPQTIDGVLSVFLPRYARDRPNVRIKLSEAIGTALLAMLERGEVHVVVTTAGLVQSGNHRFKAIWLPSLEFVAACIPHANSGTAANLDVRRLGSHRFCCWTRVLPCAVRSTPHVASPSSSRTLSLKAARRTPCWPWLKRVTALRSFRP